MTFAHMKCVENLKNRKNQLVLNLKFKILKSYVRFEIQTLI